ncbi:ImmA/IrrE family metallo-endopeptidase [Paenibacillus tengchongensis]|uniref:ImmA/IrrE family metallo-endopeptidase n=1 Tax=Paenibacillus tengchongensis TaxID=2608684 RepID=UPI00124DD033|nr:ImmA/IrrE family metallo-endopeptidase [Paenibacillus tengchongensis]
MYSYYQTTALEKWTEELYRRLEVHEPSQISVDYIAARLNIRVHYLEMRSKAMEASAGMYTMFLDSRLPAAWQRLEFLQELCHLLRHAGSSTLMPQHFTRGQQDESERFLLYAAMPISLISRLPVPEQREAAIAFLAAAFEVPGALAMQRIDQIQRRIFQGQLIAVMEKKENGSLHSPAAP